MEYPLRCLVCWVLGSFAAEWKLSFWLFYLCTKKVQLAAFKAHADKQCNMVSRVLPFEIFKAPLAKSVSQRDSQWSTQPTAKTSHWHRDCAKLNLNIAVDFIALNSLLESKFKPLTMSVSLILILLLQIEYWMKILWKG